MHTWGMTYNVLIYYVCNVFIAGHTCSTYIWWILRRCSIFAFMFR